MKYTNKDYLQEYMDIKGELARNLKLVELYKQNFAISGLHKQRMRQQLDLAYAALLFCKTGCCPHDISHHELLSCFGSGQTILAEFDVKNLMWKLDHEEQKYFSIWDDIRRTERHISSNQIELLKLMEAIK